MERVARLPLALAAGLLAAGLAQAQAGPDAGWRIAGDRPLVESASLSLGRLDLQAELPFASRRADRDGQVRILAGGRLAVGGFAPDEAAVRFLSEHGGVFGLPAGFETEVLVRGERSPRVEVTFREAGLPILGASATVLFDEAGRITGAVVDAPPDATILGLRALDAGAAIRAAWPALERYRASCGRPLRADWRAPRATEVWSATQDGLVPAWSVLHVAPYGAEAITVLVDARDGGILRRGDLVLHGTGRWPTCPPGGSITFQTGSAQGRVYRNQNAALSHTTSLRTLGGWSQGVNPPGPLNIPKGFLMGARIGLLDAADNANNDGLGPQRESGVFDFSHTSATQAHNFDLTNVYYQVETFFAHLKGNLDETPGINRMLPAIVNIEDENLVAFFTAAPEVLDGLSFEGFCPLGALGFADGSRTSFNPFQDTSRDPTVVAHEYTHAFVHFEGAGTDDELDAPTRAVQEALADFYATTFHQDTVVGRYVVDVYAVPPDGEGLRDLQDEDHFPATVADAMTLTKSGLPEEHRSSEVLGSMLTDLRLQVGAQKAERLVFESLPFVPTSIAEVGFPVVTPENSLDASGQCFFDCVLALVFADAEVPGDSLGAILGAATGRGILGDPESTQRFVFSLEPRPLRKIVLRSRFVVEDTPQSFFFLADQGRSLRVKIKAPEGSQVHPEFEILGANGERDPVLATTEPIVTDGGQTIEQLGIQLLLPDDAGYEIRVSTHKGGLGQFNLTLDA